MPQRMRPRIALVVPALELGGGVPAVGGFALSTLRSYGAFDVSLISLTQTSREECNARISSPSSLRRGVTVRTGEWMGSPFTHVGAHLSEFEFRRYLPRAALTRLVADCDLVQVVAGFPAWANSVIGLGKPVSLHCATLARLERRMRDASGTGVLGGWRRMMTRLTDRMDMKALTAVDAFQAMNPWLEAYAREVNRGRGIDIRYAPPGIDSDFFVPAAQRDCGAYLLCVGRLDDLRKNVGLLAPVLAKVRSKHDVRLVLAGQAAPPEAFWEQARAHGVDQFVDVRLAPSAEELRALYQQAAAVVLPSDEEGFGMVVVEAMACGVPVVSTRSGGPEGIITDAEDGFLVPRDDAASFADRVSRLLASEALNRSMGVKARATVQQRYSRLAAGAVFHDIWKRLLERHSDSRCAA
jgi:glycosyltransferase involved in cell wall biosynthesis